MNYFHEYLIQHSLKSGGTKDHLGWVKVPATALYWNAWLKLRNYNIIQYRIAQVRFKEMHVQCNLQSKQTCIQK
jgi:hypothetical protein